jgi:hypothetical protein
MGEEHVWLTNRRRRQFHRLQRLWRWVTHAQAKALAFTVRTLRDALALFPRLAKLRG